MNVTTTLAIVFTSLDLNVFNIYFTVIKFLVFYQSELNT